MKPQLCPMCGSASCEAIVSSPNPCPTYFALREALFPRNDKVGDDAVMALFWLAQQLGAAENSTREWQLKQLVALFAAARRAAFRAAETARVAQPAQGGREALAKALQNVTLTSREEHTLGWLAACGDATVDDVVSIVTKATAWLARADKLH